MTLQEKIKYLRKKKRITQEQLAQIIGVERSTIGKYETVTTPSMEILAILADYFDVSVDYLLGRETNSDTLPPFDNIFPITKKRYPLLGDIACGEPIFADEQYDSYVMASDDIDADFCLRAKGDSMIGARIMDGDIVFIKKMPMVDNGQIAAIIIGEEATLKRVYYYRDRQKLMLSPENPKYEPLMYVGEELNEIRILGRAVALTSRIK